MERKMDHFGLAALYAERRYRRHPHFLDAVEQVLDWSRIERKLKKKLRRSDDDFILTGHVTTANCSDTTEMERLVRTARFGKKSRVYEDKGFCQSNRDVLRQRKLKNGIMDKATRGHKLSTRQKQRNRLISAVRGVVERGFGTLKRCYGLHRARYLGVLKVEAAFLLAALAFNLKKAVY